MRTILLVLFFVLLPSVAYGDVRPSPRERTFRYYPKPEKPLPQETPQGKKPEKEEAPVQSEEEGLPGEVLFSLAMFGLGLYAISRIKVPQTA